MHFLFHTIIFFLMSSLLTGQEINQVKAHFQNSRFKYDDVRGIGHEPGCTRRDPSDIIKYEDTYYVYYTKVYGRSSGYWGSIWYASSQDDGFTWEEQGEILGLGQEGCFDSQATFTPNILFANGNFYLYYTGVKPTPGNIEGAFENNATTDITAIGVAISNAPDGPFQRISSNPILPVSVEPEKFDSYRVDDASMLYRNGIYWLYYKGRSRIHGSDGPAQTQMGVAFSQRPEGPFTKYGKPILAMSHEVLIWPQGHGVGALASASGTLEYAPDGIDFKSENLNVKIENRPNAPGVYRPDLTQRTVVGQGLSWGIGMIHNGPEAYLVRFQWDAQ
jgi:hypothetical protein